jgi:hypothetical protein
MSSTPHILNVEMTYSPIVNFAMQQNHVPVIRRLTTKDDLSREGAKLFGFARSGINVETAMRKGINMALVKGYVMEKDGRAVFVGK